MLRPLLPMTAILLLLAACTATPSPAASASSPSPSPSPSSASPTPASPPPPSLPNAYNASDTSGFRPVCKGTSYSGAAAYTGRGPHPIAFFGYGEVSDWNSGLFPTDLGGADAKWYAKAYGDLQLVACVDARIGKQLRDCGTYLGAKNVKVRLHYGDYKIDVYEARTARPVVKGLRLRGEASKECPAAISHVSPDKNGVIKRITELSGPQVSKAVGRYVTGSA